MKYVQIQIETYLRDEGHVDNHQGVAHDGSQLEDRALACDHGSREVEVLSDIQWKVLSDIRWEGGPFGIRREGHVYQTRLLSCNQLVGNGKIRVVVGSLKEEEGVARDHGSRLVVARAWG